MSGYEQAQEYAAVAADSAGMSAQKLATYQESLEAKTNKAAAAFENLSMTLLDSGIIGGVMDLGTAIFNAGAAFDAWPAKIALLVAGFTAFLTLIKAISKSNLAAGFTSTFKSLAERTEMMGASNWIIVAGQYEEAA